MTTHISPAELHASTKGSHHAHERLVEAVRLRLQFGGIEAFPIYTGGIPKYLPGGQLVLRTNPHQIGIADLLAPFWATHDCGRPMGRMAFLECKTGRARRHPGQVRTQRLFESFGFLCVLVRRQEDVDPIIEAHRKARRLACR